MSELRVAHEVQVKATPSLLYNNLSHAPDGRMFYISKGDVCVAAPLVANCTRVPIPDENGQGTLCHHVRCADAKTAVAVTANALYLIDIHSLSITASTPLVYAGLSTIVAAGSISAIIVGFSNGSVVLVDGRSGAQSAPVAAHRYAVTDASVTSQGRSQADFALSSDSVGTVSGYGISSGALVLKWAHHNANGDACTSVCAAPAFAVCGYGSGHIRLLDAATGSQFVEIAAHTRWINALAYSPSRNEVYSASEDMLLCVWGLPRGPAETGVALRGYKHMKDCLLTGVSVSDDEKSVAISVFDQDKISVFNL